jgi:transcription antitermination factor NusG
LTEQIESIQKRLRFTVKEEESPMTADPSGSQEPEEMKFNFSPGQSVRIVEGPFTEFVGTVSESNREQQKVTVLISYWGKPTPFFFDFHQVEKIDLFLP